MSLRSGISPGTPRKAMMRAIGFTGTQRGLSRDQRRTLRYILERNLPEIPPAVTHFAVSQFHHGSCVGADDQAGWIAHLIGYAVIVHPPLDDKLRAYSYFDELKDEEEYLKRDRDIVHASRMLLACPDLPSDSVLRIRSGTGYTTRYAIKHNRYGSIIWRDGATELFSEYVKRTRTIDTEFSR
jgi:hypothetical protein